MTTTEGHLLAIWEVGTPQAVIAECLVQLGIASADQGRLDISATSGIAASAAIVRAAGVPV